MSDNHKLYELALNDRDLFPVIAIGPAGTGKTFGAAQAAVSWLNDKRKKVVVTRPNVSFAKELGFIPGTEREKLGPWIKPIEQNFMFHGMKRGDLESKEKSGQLTYIALEHIQGLTFDDTFLIVDEAENMSMDQMKVLLTRVGKYSKVVLCGDIAQTSPKFRNSGLAELVEMIYAVDVKAHVIQFTHEDILRSAQCKEWIVKWDEWDAMKGDR